MVEKAEKGKPALTPLPAEMLSAVNSPQEANFLGGQLGANKGGDSAQNNQRGGGGGTSRVGRTGKRKVGSANTKRGRTVCKC